MKLDYGTLLSFDMFETPFGFNIKSPTLKEVGKIQFGVYQSYLSNLNLDIKAYYNHIADENANYFDGYTSEEKELILRVKEEYVSLSDLDKSNVSPIFLFSYDKTIISSISKALSFFTDKTFKYSEEHKAFVSIDGDKIVATLELGFYDEIIDMILQRNGINKPKKEEVPKFKSKTAEKLYYRTLEAKEKNEKRNKVDKNFELPNLMSSVSARHNSINIVNIWDMTVYQLYDQFYRLQNNCIFEIQAMSVSAWGDKDSKFDQTMWYKNLNTQN